MINDIDIGNAPTMARRSLGPAREQKGSCICRNLTALADAFSELSSLEVLRIPEIDREAAREAVAEVWQILELVRDIEGGAAWESQTEFAATDHLLLQ